MTRPLVLLVALGVPAVALFVLKSPWHALLSPWLATLAPGPRELAAHLLFGLPAALLSLAAIVALRLGPVSFRPTWPAVGQGVALALVSLLVTLPLLTTSGWAPFGGWGAVGNLVSNFYEELSFRGLVVLGVLRCWNRPALAVVVSALLFALARVGAPWQAQLNLFLLGGLYAAAFCRNRNLFVPWLGHTLTDFTFNAL